MDHVVYVDAKAKEMERLMDGSKTMIIRGAAGRKMPYGRVNEGDILYLMNNNGEGVAKARCRVTYVHNSKLMTKEESTALVDDHQNELQLTKPQYKKWAGKRYLVLIRVTEVEALQPFSVDRSDYGNMDDWLPVEDIEKVKIT